MAVFVDVDDNGLLPAKDEVARAGAEDDGDAEPAVVGHEDEHEEVADGDLHHVEHGLQ